MEYRILLILSRLYRRWASIRLKDLHAWIQRWQMPEMYAGVPGGGAELAWWHLSAINEDARHSGADIAGATVDIYKCFDHVMPLLGQALMLIAGIPANIRNAYCAMMQTTKLSTCCRREQEPPTPANAHHDDLGHHHEALAYPL